MSKKHLIKEASQIDEIQSEMHIEKFRSTIDNTHQLQKLSNQPKAMLRLFDQETSGHTSYVEQKQIKGSSK